MKRRTRKRTLLTVLLLLTGGAIINVAVAWGLACYGGPTGSGSELIALGDRAEFGATCWTRIGSERWFCHNDEVIPPSDPSRSSGRIELPQLGISDAARRQIRSEHQWRNAVTNWLIARELNPSQGPHGTVPFDLNDPDHQKYDDSIHAYDFRGWPARSLGCDFSPEPNLAHKVSDLRFGYLLSPHPTVKLRGVIEVPWLEIRVLPLKPLWPGFAINTILYAAILWLLLAAPFALRRRIRARRGQCPACGYPIGSSTVCTECGKSVTPRA